MPKLKAGTILPTPAEDAAITTASMADPDAVPFTDTEWGQVKPLCAVARLSMSEYLGDAWRWRGIAGE